MSPDFNTSELSETHADVDYGILSVPSRQQLPKLGCIHPVF